jgi:hypothetical protein
MLIDALLLIGIPGLLIIMMGSVPYGIWFVVSVCRKRWRLALAQITIPVLLVMVLGMVASMVESRRYEAYLADVFGAPVELATPLFAYESPREFNGDGYSIEVYPLPRSLRTFFVQRDRNHLSNFPKLPDYRDGWTSQSWREGPLEKGFRRHLEFAVSSVDSAKVSGLEAQFTAIRTCLSRPNAFYACFVNDRGDHIGDIDFFVVDLEQERIYLINHNT